MKLAIISHTLHYRNPKGEIVGWGPTVTEINYLTTIFDQIYHIAVLSDEQAPKSALVYKNDTIELIPLKKVGGSGIVNKLKVLGQMPHVIQTVNQILPLVDLFQFRAPTGMGVYLIPYLSLFSKKNGWFKYAGNWKEVRPALGFYIQRWLLKNQKRKVTINGNWPNQEKHCISFENPCLSESHREEGLKILENNEVLSKVNFCFVGTFYKRKGIDKILEALKNLDSERIGTFYFVGAGGSIEKYQKRATQIDLKIEFTGFLSKNEIHTIYAQCDYIVLPSDNEGFPKVIGEAMNYGCIPIVSNVSCIAQYIKHRENGYLLEPNSADRLLDVLKESLHLEDEIKKDWKVLNYQKSKQFTYSYYVNQIQNKILDSE
jgi:glycosyltransferase involved in cell wall biosynthesis